MTRAAIEQWFQELLKQAASLTIRNSTTGLRFDERQARAWSIEAESAIAAIFPQGHPTRQAWARVLNTVGAGSDISVVALQLVGVFESAERMIRNNRIGTLVDAIRNETESGLLDQALVLVEANHLAAGTVIAGGALETHLSHYVAKYGITISGDGSISKYNNAVGAARSSNSLLYSTTDGKLVEAWGGFRNDAAHKPGTFSRSQDDVKRMVEGIREFISRAT
jgi:hypothetical protein